MHTKNFIITGTFALIALILILVGAYNLQPKGGENITNERGESVVPEANLGDEPAEVQDGTTDRRALPFEETPTAIGKIKADVFTGTLQTVDTGCFADGECFVEVGGKHVTALMGWSRDTVGTVQGVEGFGDLEQYIGKQVEVYAQVKEDGTYTLYGSEGFYIKLIDGEGTSMETPKPITANGCMVGGCSGQLCVDSATGGDMATTCEYRAEYACYKEATCERQPTGKCGWTETSELRACLNTSTSNTLEVM